MKPFLSDRDKKILFLVLPLQLLVNIAVVNPLEPLGMAPLGLQAMAWAPRARRRRDWR